MFAKGKTSIILKASGFALLWVSIITCTIFPDLLGKENHFLTEQYNFEYVGQVLLLALGVYTFDLMIQVLYAIDKHLSKIFIVQISGCVTICILAIFLTKNMEVYNIYPFLFVGVSMAYMKAFTLFVSDKTKKIENRKLRIRAGGL